LLQLLDAVVLLFAVKNCLGKLGINFKSLPCLHTPGKFLLYASFKIRIVN